MQSLHEIYAQNCHKTPVTVEQLRALANRAGRLAFVSVNVDGVTVCVDLLNFSVETLRRHLDLTRPGWTSATFALDGKIQTVGA